MTTTQSRQLVARVREVRAVTNIIPSQRITQMLNCIETLSDELDRARQSPWRRAWRWIVRR